MHSSSSSAGANDRPRSAGPQNLLAAISWALLATVMFGGYALLRLLTTGDNLTDHEEQFFRAGHGHAGVLAAIGILYGGYLGRTHLSARHQIAAWSVYLAGVLLLTGGMFIHMQVGEKGSGSSGTTMTMIGGVVLATAVIYLAWRLFQARDVGDKTAEREVR